MIILEAVEALPPQIKEKLQDVAIVVEHGQPAQRHSLVLGLYEGVPLTAWGRDYSGKLPDKITIFQDAIELIARTPEEIPHIIRETLWHEIAHYFGYGHDRIHEMEERWKAQRN